ncbi:MAG: hypothetical protein RLZZ385_2323 [Pseudomonadota bacterium]|jgi:hypothetical protein
MLTLQPITRADFSLWSEFRPTVYADLGCAEVDRVVAYRMELGDG